MNTFYCIEKIDYASVGAHSVRPSVEATFIQKNDIILMDK